MSFDFFPFGRRPASRPASRHARCESLESRIALTASALSNETLEDIAAPLAMEMSDPHEDHMMYPGGVMVTPTEVHTHQEVIPRFAANPTISSVRNGSWDDPATWSAGRVPRSGDRVSIGESHTVALGSQLTARIDALEISGSLMFSTSVNTRLLVANLMVMPTGHLRIGTPEAPIAQNVNAEIVIADKPLDLSKDPRQFGTGLIALGEVTIHGAVIPQTWQRLAAEPKAGDRVLFLSQPLTGWQPGDTIVLPDSRQVPAGQLELFTSGAVDPQWEEAVIQFAGGNVVILAEPLKFAHPGARNSNGTVEFFPHIALLDRNVSIRSENPTGTRGHTLFTARADVSISFAEFRDLGRTDALRPLDNTTFDEQGVVTHVGTNQVGRYAIHLHHLMGPENSTNSGYQFELVGNSIHGTKKWGLALHGASYGLVDRNVLYNGQGAGLVTEDGTEIGNAISNNISIRMQGTYEDGKEGTAQNDFGRGGVGFWFRRGGNVIVGNVATDNTFAGFVISGYNLQPMRLPLFRGADIHDPAQSVDGTLTPATPMLNNEAYGLSPMGLWAAYVNGNNNLPGQGSTLIVNLRLWHIHYKGVWAYHTSNLQFSGLVILGDVNARSRNDFGATGLDLRLYESLNTLITNSRIEGMYTGVRAPTNDGSQFGTGSPTVISNTVLKNYVNVLVSPPQEGLPTATNIIELRNVKFELPTRLPSGPILGADVPKPVNIAMRLEGDYIDYTRQSVVRVYSYNQVPGVDFQVFYNEQVADFIVPQTNPEVLGIRDRASLGSPARGLTNAQNWSKYGIAIAGSVAPSSARASYPEIAGLIAPIQTPPSVPRVVLLTPWDNSFTTTPVIRVRYNLIGSVPAGAQVYLQLDDNPPALRIPDSQLLYVQPGVHTVRAYIGDANGQQLPGTSVATSKFTRF